jgi:hypothetical protein
MKLIKEVKKMRERAENTDIPRFVTRVKAVEILGGALARGTLANMDCAGTGPKERILIGGKIAYPRDSFLSWVKERTGYDI